MSVRKAAPNDWRELRRLAKAMFRSGDEIDGCDEQIFVCDRGNGRLCGFISVSARPWSGGSANQPAAHVEAWFVDRKNRRQGVGKRLMQTAEHWARLNGFAEICSDAELKNLASLGAHRSLGFEPTVQLQHFRKPLL